MKIHHIGYLVKNIQSAIDTFGLLGYVIEHDITFDQSRNVYICFLCNENYRIELVSPASNDSVVSDMLKKYKNTPYHICYLTDCFDKDLTFYQNNGYVQISEPALAPAINNRNVVFLYNSFIGIIELLEEEKAN